MVEAAGDQQFDWSYYDTVFQKIRDRGLKIVPIMSFHKCGGGPGDNCDIPLPSWLGSHFAGLGPDDLHYESGWEGGPGQFDRSYDRNAHGSEIFALGRVDSAIYTSRP